MRTEHVLREMTPTVERLLGACGRGREAWNLLAEMDRMLTAVDRVLRTWRRNVRRRRPSRNELVRGILQAAAWERDLRLRRLTLYEHLVGRDRCQRLMITRQRLSENR